MKHSTPALYVEVDLNRIRENLAVLKQWVKPAAVMVVVKSNAYGHGLVPVARAAQSAGVAGLGVISSEEALELRRAGLTAPIIILGWVDPAASAQLAEYAIEISCFSPTHFQALSRDSAKFPQPLKIHLKIETGLGRLGFQPQELKLFTAAPQLELAGLYSHFASVEETNLGHARDQLQRFLKAAGAFNGAGIVRHIASTASGLVLPEARLDLVRIGIGMYGLWPSQEVRELVKKQFGSIPQLQPALGWKTRIVHINSVSAGGYVGYGCSWQASRPSRIGVLPVGYAEGLARVFGNGGSVLVDGQPAPIVGRICMNMTMIDVTQIPGAREGAEVVIIGVQGKENRTADDWARIANTINYEVVTRIPSQIPRVYTP